MARDKKLRFHLEEKALYKALSFLKNGWGLAYTEIALMIQVPEQTLNRWFSKKKIHRDKSLTLDSRLSLFDLLRIHQNLYSMFSEKNNQLAWLKTPHSNFGKPPLEVMKERGGLNRVRCYLDAIRDRGA